MPIYEYECKKCSSVFEIMQAISAKPLKTCMGAGCNGKDNGKVRRLISVSGFVLKGSGWYATDYPSEARKKGIQEETKTTSSTATDSSAESTASSSDKTPNGTPAKNPSSPPKPVEKKSSQKSSRSDGKKKT